MSLKNFIKEKKINLKRLEKNPKYDINEITLKYY